MAEDWSGKRQTGAATDPPWHSLIGRQLRPAPRNQIAARFVIRDPGSLQLALSEPDRLNPGLSSPTVDVLPLAGAPNILETLNCRKPSPPTG